MLASTDGGARFSITASENGTALPNGNYYLPKAMLTGEYSVPVSIIADIGFKIGTISVDGETVVPQDSHETTLEYVFTEKSSAIKVTFVEDPEDGREELTVPSVYAAPDFLDGAVAKGVALQVQENIFDYMPVHTGSTEKYLNTMGVSTGSIYAADGKTYEMIKAIVQDTPTWYSIAEVVNALYEQDGWIYGKEYDLLRMYNYYELTDRGPDAGEKMVYCAYAYKEIDPETLHGKTVSVGDDTYNTAAIFVQAGSHLDIDNFTADSETNGLGPAEAGNFFGLGSAVHVDGGDILQHW